MTRLGRNPYKTQPARAFAAPAPLSLCTITCVPVEAGYWRDARAILDLCLSRWRTVTPDPHDLIVLDQGSCPAIQDWLLDKVCKGDITTAILSSRNLGKTGAWNVLFGAAQGEWLAYADSDVLHHPGWFTQSRAVFDGFPRAGAVAGCGAPHSAAVGSRMAETLAIAHHDHEITAEPIGQSAEWLRAYARSVDESEATYLAQCQAAPATKLTRRGVSAWALSSHFQFLTRRDIAQRLGPFSQGGRFSVTESEWEQRLIAHGYMSLSTVAPCVEHLGNRLPTGLGGAPDGHLVGHARRWIDRIPKLRGVLQRTYDGLFALLAP